MKKSFIHKFKNTSTSKQFYLVVAFCFGFFFFLFIIVDSFLITKISYTKGGNLVQADINTATNFLKNFITPMPVLPPLDTVAYDKKINELANNPLPKGPTTKIVSVKNKDGTITKSTVTVPAPIPPPNPWPVKTIYPNAGAILPFNRIIAYYGNLYSNKMGVLGQYPETEMLERLDAEVKKWNIADPGTPVIPALHYIVVVAQGNAGADGKYKLRMPDIEIDKVLIMAAKINALVFLDFQVGFSTLDKELPIYKKYFQMPNVHLGIDPEFSMKGKIRPGKIVGTYDAMDINFATNFLAEIVRENNLPPKILVVHRYTQKMVTNYKLIRTVPEVQIIMHMDGWGGASKKLNTYQQFIYKEPVQFAGFKLFYKHDVLEPRSVLMTPNDLLKLNPRPIYIQYQ